ncbi:PIG-L deacetylase family protein [Variovorax sp. HJSM1_2]|uniref:PIG-L deacetylase family protein n=1 Tax=Variovorax sp. HJSM1_2 TaxID=3366263 RepID=UPI003BDC4E99
MDIAPEQAHAETRQIVGEGTAEPVWRAWLGECAVPRLCLDEVLRADQRLVVLAPHPDDEVLACGGLLASHAARGGACLVLAVTDGEASHAGSKKFSPHALAQARRAESSRGLVVLGVSPTAVVRLGLPDGQVAAHSEKLASALQLVLQPGDVVLSTWRKDGHPDHEATGHVAADICAQKGLRFLEAPVWMWHWARPGHAQVPWRQMAAFGLNDTTLALKCRALAAHASQLKPRDGPDPAPVLGPAIRERATRPSEYFFELV